MNEQARFRRFWVALLVLPCALTMAGCGSSQGTVSGKLSYMGTPLRGGSVTIFPATGGGMMKSDIAEDGSYTISKVPLGSVKISVETSSMKPAAMPPGMAAMYANRPKDAPGADLSRGAGDPKRYVPIPDKYGNPDESGLSYSVHAGQNDHNIELK